MPQLTGSTGRIKKNLTQAARKILFEDALNRQIEEELPYICQIDFAHVLMLVERKIIKTTFAQSLLRAISALTRENFAPLKSRPSFRGLFLLYETYLIETQGADVGGILQTGRSRNDLNASLLKLRLRGPYVEMTRAMLRLQAVLIQRAHRYAEVVMPAYTHGQAAEPISYGHYLAGVAEALSRDIDGLIESTREIDTCPLGAGTVAGTSVPIDPERTAELLGFERVTLNSVDAVASRDLVFRLLAAMAICGATLSRIATDLLQWLTAEFQFLCLPDELVGSSSAMPQKRNPFLLEHVQGRTASPLGAFASALGSVRNTPFTNSIAVGTEAVRPLWRALQDLTEAATFLRLLLFRAEPKTDRMLRRAAEGFTTATALACRMVSEKGIDFRTAHRAIGQAITEALATGAVSLEEFLAGHPEALDVSLAGMDPASCVKRAQYGGGPSPRTLEICLSHLHERWSSQRKIIRTQTERWSDAQGKLQETVAAFCGF